MFIIYEIAMQVSNHYSQTQYTTHVHSAAIFPAAFFFIKKNNQRKNNN